MADIVVMVLSIIQNEHFFQRLPIKLQEKILVCAYSILCDSALLLDEGASDATLMYLADVIHDHIVTSVSSTCTEFAILAAVTQVIPPLRYDGGEYPISSLLVIITFYLMKEDIHFRSLLRMEACLQ